MKKLLLIMLGIFLLVGTLTAIGLNKTDSTIDIDKAKLDILKTTGIESINVKASPMICDDKECWTDVYQGNLIQTKFRTIKNYCSERNETTICLDYDKDWKNCIKQSEPIYVCLAYTDYTPTQLIFMRDKFVKGKIELYANSLIADASKSAVTQIDDGGVISVK
jgi:hypothetical protein